MSDAESSLEQLTDELLVECSNQKSLRDIPENEIKQLIETLIRFQFSEDNRRSAQTNLDKIVTQIVDNLEDSP
jgi:hypothetical protein